MDFSLLMSVYVKDCPIQLSQALQSVYDNSLQPTQVVMVFDGILPDALEDVVAAFQDKLGIEIIRLPKNKGLGYALCHGLLHCRHDWVARFDSDDICKPNRFEVQTLFLASHPHVDVLGSQITEFDDDVAIQVACRTLPTEHKDIVHFAKQRNPINHMTVFFKKDLALKAGSYREEDYWFEDYALWVRMIQKGAVFANLTDNLVAARVGNHMFQRRGGWHYAKQELNIQRQFYRQGFISLFAMLRNIATRLPVRMMPNKLRQWVYERFIHRI